MHKVSPDAYAFLICVAGMGLVDQAIRWFRPALRHDLRGSAADAAWARIEIYAQFKPVLTILGIALVLSIALLVARPKGIERQEFRLLGFMLLGLTIGRSFLGVGEGLSITMLFVAIPAILLVLLLQLATNR